MTKHNNVLSVLYSVVIPLFNVTVNTEGEKAYQFTWNPPQAAPQGIALDGFTITLFKWDYKVNISKSILKQYCQIESLPQKFDYFDGFPQQHASGMIVIQVCESYPPKHGQDILIQLSNSPYTDKIISSFEQSLKLYNDTEPHLYKGYYFKNGLNTGTVIHFPIKEMQGTIMQIDKEVLNGVNKLFFMLLAMDETDRESVGYRVIQIALRYYILSSRQTEYDVIFLILMISFEALFKQSDEDSVSRARVRFGKLLAESKAEYSQISRFMSENPNDRGCCFLRNAIVHGDENASSVESQTFWDLKRYIRKAIVEVLDNITNHNIEQHNYYSSLDQYVNSRFENLPNN